jgi:hypothetical protein
MRWKIVLADVAHKEERLTLNAIRAPGRRKYPAQTSWAVMSI